MVFKREGRSNLLRPSLVSRCPTVDEIPVPQGHSRVIRVSVQNSYLVDLHIKDKNKLKKRNY